MEKDNRGVASLYNSVKQLITAAREKSYRAINFLMVEAYWNIGRMIVAEEQQGKKRANYGGFLIKELSKQLTAEYGKGFSANNLWYMRQFFVAFPILHAVSGESVVPIDTINENFVRLSPHLRPELSWTHYRLLLRLQNTEARMFYMIESATNNWSTRELDRQINSLLFERLALSQNRKAVVRMARRGQTIQRPDDLVKDPYVLEFLGLEKTEKYYEEDLEKALINHLQTFLLELGRGFSFVGRQKRITLDGDHFYIDLVFYNRLTKSHILFDLKVGRLTHSDIGQMQMYVNYYNRTQKTRGENDTIGIILCADKNSAVVKYALPEKQRHIFISKYVPYLPSEEELKAELLRERNLFDLERKLSQ